MQSDAYVSCLDLANIKLYAIGIHVPKQLRNKKTPETHCIFQLCSYVYVSILF